MRSAARTFVCVASVAALAACAPASAPALRDRLIIADSWEPRSLDPLMLQGTQAGLVNNLLYSYLIDVDDSGNPVPALAVVVPTLANGGISADGKTIRYHLRRGVRFSDGSPLTAHDAAFTIAAVMNPRNAVASRYGYDQIAAVSAPDDLTLVLRTKAPFSPLLTTVLGPGGNYGVLPARLLAHLTSIDHADFSAKPVGSGPYVLTRWDRGDAMAFVPNPRYYGGRPSIGAVVWKFVPSPQTMVAQLLTGEVDAVVGAPPESLAELRHVPGHRTAVAPFIGLAEFQFNTTNPLFVDPRVRRAVVMAIDWPRAVSRVTLGTYDTAAAMRGVFGWAYDATARYPGYDPKASAALLQSAGWTRAADGVWRKGLQALQFTVTVPADEVTLTRLLTQIQADAASAGIRIEPRVIGKTLFKSFAGPVNGGRYEASIDRFAAAPDPDPGWLVSCADRAPNGFNRSRYCNPAVDAALRDATATFDRSRRIRDYAFVQRELAGAVPFYPIYQDRTIDVVPLRLHGYAPSTQGLPLSGIEHWSLR